MNLVCTAKARRRIAAVPESSSTTEVGVLNCFAVLNYNNHFDSDAVLLPCLISEFSSARQKRDV